MGIFDLFTGDSVKEAAAQNEARLAQNKIEGTGTLQQNKMEGTNTYQQGQTGAIDALKTAGGYYAPLAQKYGGATGLALDALGVNGQEGNARATGAFQAGPGYQWAVNQALDQTNRAANRNGMLVSGNTLAALSDRSQNMANQEYGSWVDRLRGFTNPELLAATGQSDAYTRMAPVYTGTANSIANLGTNTANNIVGLGTNTMNGINQQNTQAANAEMQGSANLWGFGLNAAKALMPGGSLLSNLGGGQTMTNPYDSMPKVGSGWNG